MQQRGAMCLTRSQRSDDQHADLILLRRGIDAKTVAVAPRLSNAFERDPALSQAIRAAAASFIGGRGTTKSSSAGIRST